MEKEMKLKMLQEEAARIGYKLVPNPVNTKWMRCLCGSKDKNRIYLSGNRMKVTCVNCGFSVTDSEKTVKLKWNEVINDAKSEKAKDQEE